MEGWYKMVQTVAAICLLGFIALMAAIGIYSSKKAKTMTDFLLGGRNIGPWLSAFSYGTAYFSAVIFIGYAGKMGWEVGISSVWIGIGNAILGSLLAWLLLAKKTRDMTKRLQASTTPEFFEARYQSSGMRIYSALIIFIFLVPYAATVYRGLGMLFSTIFTGLENNPFGLSPEIIVMLIVAVLTSVYLVLGGYMATALTDFVQGLIMILGICFMVYGVVNNDVVGGLKNGLRQIRDINPDFVNIWGGSNAKSLLINILLTSFGTWGLPHMLHKYYAIKDESSIKKATVISTVFALIIGGGAYFTGCFGRLYLNNTLPAAGYDAVVPNLLMGALSGTLWSNIVLSMILLLLLSASMSTLASIVLSSSSAVTVDLIRKVKPDIDKKKEMIIMRMLCFLFILLSFLFAAMNFAVIVSIMSFSWGVVSGCFIGPYVWGLFSKKTTKAAAWCGNLSGIVIVGGLTLVKTFAGGGFKAAMANAPLYGVIAMAVSIVVVPLVSMFTKKLPQNVVDTAFSGESK